jgi:hypothetical protein
MKQYERGKAFDEETKFSHISIVRIYFFAKFGREFWRRIFEGKNSLHWQIYLLVLMEILIANDIPLEHHMTQLLPSQLPEE